MPSQHPSEFIFALTNPGSEKALKNEVLGDGLPWRSSYQRKGFVTFKGDGAFSFEDLAVSLTCTRRLCLSLGKSSSRDAAIDLISGALGEDPRIHLARHHLGKMEGIHVPGEPVAAPASGEIVGTVVELGPHEFWAGLHRHGPMVSPDPAGDPGLVMPDESPSRAWLKLEEAVRFFNLRFTSTDRVVELGCAPGGVVIALMRRGVPVVGIDPAGMDAVLKPFTIPDRARPPEEQPWFYHCRKPAALVSKRDLGQNLTWFMSDMNQKPEVVLKECARFCKMAPGIAGLLITLKLSSAEQVAEKGLWIATVAKLGFKTIRIQQLSAHHREVALYACR
jgi:23S rRNA (cytidine2498-2'-O)-methyltransferase